MKKNSAWIFFDCFNTLVDDFDDMGDELVMDVPVIAGFYESTEAFWENYDRWRDEH